MDTFVPSFSGKKGTGKSGKGDQYKEWDKLHKLLKYYNNIKLNLGRP